MEFENLLTLIKTVSDSELTDFDYEENGTRIRLKKKKKPLWFLALLQMYRLWDSKQCSRWDRSQNQKQRWRKILQMVNQRVCL